MTKKRLIVLCVMFSIVKTSFGQYEKYTSYREIRSLTIEYYQSKKMDSSILVMEYAMKKFPDQYGQITQMLGSLHTRVGNYSKAVKIWKAGIDKGYFYNLNNKGFNEYYKDNPDFKKLALIEKKRTEASHMKYEVILPSNYNNNKRYPTLFIFHGNNSNIETSKMSWNSPIMKDKYISIFVQSYIFMSRTDFKWVPNDDKTNKEFKEIYDSVLKTYPVDNNKIIFAGMSAGGRKVIEYAFNEFIPITGLVLNCPVVPDSIGDDNIKKFVEKNKKIGIITGEKDFALKKQKDLINNIKNQGGKNKLIINKDIGHVFADDFSNLLNEYLKWVIE